MLTLLNEYKFYCTFCLLAYRYMENNDIDGFKDANITDSIHKRTAPLALFVCKFWMIQKYQIAQLSVHYVSLINYAKIMFV